MFETDFIGEVKKYLINRINDIGFDVSSEKIDRIMKSIISFANDPYYDKFGDERDRLDKTNNKINEEINALVMEHNKEMDLKRMEEQKKIEERRSKETIRQKLDRIEDYLIELKRILKEKE